MVGVLRMGRECRDICNVDQKDALLNVSLPLFLATPIFAQDTNFKSGHSDEDGSLL